MSNSIQRDQKRRSLFKDLEKKRLSCKHVIRDFSVPIHIKSFYVHQLNKYSRNSSLVRVRNRCVLSGRGRGVYQFSRLSRIKMRELACQGLLLGVCKSSW